MTTLAEPTTNDATSAQGTGLTGYDVVRVLLGLLLLTAAALKGLQLATEPVANTSLLTSRWFLVIQVEFEFLFGLWLLSGLRPRATRLLAVALFGAFAAIAAYKGVTGAASCGCFGKVPVNPWYTLILDMAAVGALAAFRPMEGCLSLWPRRRPGPAAITAIAVLVGAPAAYVMSAYEPAALADDGVIIGQSNLVILEPEKWVGKRFPLLGHIDVGDKLSKGKWIVLLHHDGCPGCAEAVPRYRSMDRDLQAAGDGLAVALIEVPPCARSRRCLTSDNTEPLSGNLHDEREWFVTTPAVVLLEGALVKAAWEGKAPQSQRLLWETPGSERHHARQ